MDSNDILLKKRFEELYYRAKTRNTVEHTAFLDMNSQSLLVSLHLPCTCFGGYDNAERVVAVFYDEEYGNYLSFDDIICIIDAKVTNAKFISGVGHRDFLGAVLALGLEREVIGDIIVGKEHAYIVCLKSVADYIISSLSSAGRANLSCSAVTGIPNDLIPSPTSETRIVPSERADAMISTVFNLSRSEVQKLFAAGKVFINSRLTEKASTTLSENDIVSLRGYGRFRYAGIVKTTKKDRLAVELQIWK